LVITRPLADNSLSDCTDVADIDKYFLASSAQRGYSDSCCCQ